MQFYGMDEAQMNAFRELSESGMDALNKVPGAARHYLLKIHVFY